MSASIFVAFTGLVALAASVAGVILPMDGASTMFKLVNGPEFKAAALPTVVPYQGSGSGAGKQWVGTGNTNNQVMAFGDGAFSSRGKDIVMPSNVAEVPIAFGAIALYYNLPAIPGSSCMSWLNQCKLFNANTRGSFKTWGQILTGLPATAANIPIRVVVRSDSSGSTNAVKLYYSLVCTKYFPSALFPNTQFRFAVDTNTAPPTPQVGYVGVDGTNGVVAAVMAVRGSIGYASCGQVRSATLIELPLANVLGQCSLCRNCASSFAGAPYGPTIRCGNYGAFAVATPSNVCAWNNIIANGDKDNDGDVFGVDTDMDGDGIKPVDFPLVFIEFAYFNAVNRTPFCPLAKAIVKKMISSKFAPIYAKYGFVSLPLNMRRSGCTCIKRFCGGTPPMTGVLTAGGDCL